MRVFLYVPLAVFPVLAVSALVTAVVWWRNAGALTGRIAMVAAAVGLYVHGQFALSRLPGDTPGPFLVWLFWGFSLPIGLIGASFALNGDPDRGRQLPGRVALALALASFLVLAVFFRVGALAFIVAFGIGYWICVLARKGTGSGTEKAVAARDARVPDGPDAAAPGEGDAGDSE